LRISIAHSSLLTASFHFSLIIAHSSRLIAYIYRMQKFRKTVSGIDFDFHGIMEGEDEIYRVSAENQSFKMTVDEEGYWQIRQQVPSWIKVLEADLGEAIEKNREKNVKA